MLVRILLQSLVGAAFLAALLCVPAGTWAWPQAWIYVLLFSACSVATAIWLLSTDRALLEARMQSPLRGDQRPRDRAIAAVLFAFCSLWFVFIALDARRFTWSQVPLWGEVLGALLVVWSFWGWVLVLRANSFAATNIRVQGERNQTVISTGPYAIVRHPMYACVLPFAVGTSLLLGSLWGLFGILPLSVILAARSVSEEAVLREGLPGYSAYAAKVRFRLVPGIW